MSKLSQSKRPKVAVPIPGASRFAKYTPGFMEYAPQKKAPSRRDKIRAEGNRRRIEAARAFGYGGARRLGSIMAASISPEELSHSNRALKLNQH